MINDENFQRLKEISKIFKEQDSILNASEQLLRISYSLIGHYRRHRPKQEKEAMMKYCASAVMTSLEVLVSSNCTQEQINHLLSKALEGSEQRAISKIERDKEKLVKNPPPGVRIKTDNESKSTAALD